MKGFYIFAWLLLSAIVVWYMLNNDTVIPETSIDTNANTEIEVIDEVKGSIYTQTEQDDNSEEVTDEEGEDNRISIDAGNFRKEGKTRFDFTEKAYIEFNKNSLTLPTSAAFTSYLDSVSMLITKDDFTVELVGHADNSSSKELDNYEVGLKRANHIKELLVDRGVDEAKIIVDSKGDTEPRIEDDTENARKKNRRVELFLKPN